MIPVQLLLIAALVSAAAPTASVKPNPSIAYTLTINPADLFGFDVTMRISAAPQTMRLAMAVHPEYNDRFWRYLKDLRAESSGRPVSSASENPSPSAAMCETWRRKVAELIIALK